MKTKKFRKKSRAKVDPLALPAIRPDVAGIDVGSKEHWVAAPPAADGTPNVRCFGTTTDQLQALADWLKEQGVTSVAMESTHVYWIPLFELLESRGFEVLLVNARQLHHTPGRKTDISDCQWLQVLHRCGLLRGSFRPAEAISRIRALQRQLANLVAERTRCVQWMQQALDQMNVQVHRAVSELTGVTGMAIVRDIVGGQRDPERLAQHRDARCQKSPEEIARHLVGNWREEHLFNLASALRIYDAYGLELESYEKRIAKELEALEPAARREQAVPEHPNRIKETAIRARGEQATRTRLWRVAGVDLTRIDGIGATVAQVVISEVGTDFTPFPTEKHFVSWLRLSPPRSISGGKLLKKRRNSVGASRIAAALRMAATAVRRSKSALGAAYRRLARRKGATVAVFAIARKLAQYVYRMMRYGQDYVDIGEQEYERRHMQQRLHSLRETARALGYKLVEPESSPAA